MQWCCNKTRFNLFSQKNSSFRLYTLPHLSGLLLLSFHHSLPDWKQFSFQLLPSCLSFHLNPFITPCSPSVHALFNSFSWSPVIFFLTCKASLDPYFHLHVLNPSVSIIPVGSLEYFFFSDFLNNIHFHFFSVNIISHRPLLFNPHTVYNHTLWNDQCWASYLESVHWSTEATQKM